ncbi:MAG: hypothetical protein LBS18_02895 [Clostridiales bacterium]|nr:hypothetical protein [Clostridiales bacterium]
MTAMQNGVFSIRQPALLHITDKNDTPYFAANQSWYAALWRRQAGCGPTVASTLLWYLAQTKPGCRGLCPYNGATKSGFLRLMNDVWEYVTPDMHGSSIEIFCDGITRYMRQHGVPPEIEVLNIPKEMALRPSMAELAAFIMRAFERDLPVAFQNYSNGALKNLDSWHWVTLVALRRDTWLATMYDQGRSIDIDLRLWLVTATREGKFVAVSTDGITK